MFIDLTRGRPLKCSKCGSTNAIKPINDPDVAVRCGACGHTKLTPEAEARKRGDKEFASWSYKDTDPTF